MSKPFEMIIAPWPSTGSQVFQPVDHHTYITNAVLLLSSFDEETSVTKVAKSSLFVRYKKPDEPNSGSNHFCVASLCGGGTEESVELELFLSDDAEMYFSVDGNASVKVSGFHAPKKSQAETEPAAKGKNEDEPDKEGED